MGRKKSGKHAATTFKGATQRIRNYVVEIDNAGLTDQAVTWTHEAALMKTNVAFEKLMLDCLIVALNNDSTAFSESTAIAFPKHLTERVCEFLITGGGYFDFKGRSSLIADIKRITGEPHYLHTAVKNPKYHHALELLLTLRNYAAHESPQSRQKAKRQIVAYNLKKKQPEKADVDKAYAPSSAGSWLKRQGRFDYVLDHLDALADEIHAGAPH